MTNIVTVSIGNFDIGYIKKNFLFHQAESIELLLEDQAFSPSKDATTEYIFYS
jgi:hypothetical protein